MLKGGVDFQLNKMNLEMQNSGQEIKFNSNPVMLEHLQRAPGFVPVIINIQPMNDLRLFLGVPSEPVISPQRN